MAQIRIFNEALGKIKPIHAVNNGPIITGFDQWTGNAQTYKAARIPYARNHDASFLSSYGGEHTVDITAIFPNFDADENDPASYDFHFTDEYTQKTLLMGTETFFRLGQRIEHESKKYGIHPPKDFAKWARICEHIIRHLNEGWADGHHFGITYWEIWNEADLDADDSPVRRNWTGTKAQFFELFAITAKHLKSCFPNLKIGGPGLSNNLVWADELLTYLDERNIKIDFFSWHLYSHLPKIIIDHGLKVKELLLRHGLTEAESILDEYNYVKGWTDEFVYSLRQIPTIKGATFFAEMMLRGQHAPIDMLMYYDARPCGFNGLFAPYTYDVLKPYYSLCMFSDLYALGTQIKAVCDDDEVICVGATDGEQSALMLTFYSDDDSRRDTKRVTVSFPKSGRVGVKILDKTRNAKKFYFQQDGELTLNLRPNSVVYFDF